MATMNPAIAGGPVGGGMMMMNNGSPAVSGNLNSTDNLRTTMNTVIYDYLLKHGHYEIARSIVRDEKFEMRTEQKSSPGRRKDGEMNGDAGDGIDTNIKDDVPEDLPRPGGWDGTQTGGFLLEWFSIFHDLLQAHRASGPKLNGAAMNATPASTYLMHEKHMQRMRENNQNQNIRAAGINQAMIRQMQNGAMNGNMNKPMTQQQMQQLQTRKAQMAAMQQQQMQRGEQPDGDMNGVRPGSPVEGDNGGSPSKRPRLDNAQQQFNNGMMQAGRPGGVPGAANQGMMIQAGFNPAMNPQFRANGAMPPKGMQGGMANGMMNMGNAGSPMMQNVNQFPPDGMPMDMQYQRSMQPQPGMQGGGGQSGNHALQDYQMQLMLLEQQNKKRLMMARQEQHENNPGSGGPMPGVGMQATGMSPNDSRTGTSPNPGEMKRTPGMGGGLPGSPSAAEAMAGRSPGMSFMGNMQNPDFNSGMFMGKDQPMMGGPGMRPPTSADMNPMRQPGRGNQFPGGQPMVQQASQNGQQGMGTPGQRNEMPPPQAPAGANGAQRTAGGSPNPNAPPTPSQTNKANPKAKKGAAKEDNKRARPTKKNSSANANSNDENPPATPTPSTPITPNNPAMNAGNKGQPGMPQNNQHQQQNQAMQMGQQMDQQDLSQGNNFGDFGNAQDPQFNLDFSTLENADVLENFDFDSFLNTSAGDMLDFNAEGLGGDFGMSTSD